MSLPQHSFSYDADVDVAPLSLPLLLLQRFASFLTCVCECVSVCECDKCRLLTARLTFYDYLYTYRILYSFYMHSPLAALFACVLTLRLAYVFIFVFVFVVVAFRFIELGAFYILFLYLTSSPSLPFENNLNILHFQHFLINH